MLLSKKTYRQVLRDLDHYRKQHEEDRKENPNAIPPSWGTPLRTSIERTIRENRELCPKGLPDQVLEHFVEKGLLVRYAGCYTFPTDEALPTEKQIRDSITEPCRHCNGTGDAGLGNTCLACKGSGRILNI